MAAQSVQGPRALRHLQFLAADPFRGEDGAGRSDAAAPDARDGRITRAVEVVVGDIELEAAEVAASDEVGDAADRVGAVRRRRAFLQHLQPADGDGRDGVHVHEAPSDQARRDRHVAPAVDQDQGPRRSQPAQIDVGHGFADRHRLVRIVPTAPLTDDAVADAQVAEEIDELGRPLLLQGVAADHDHRVGHVDSRGLDGGAGHRDGHLLEEATDVQGDVNRGRKPRSQLHVPLGALESGQSEGDDVAARGQRRKGVAPVAVGYCHLRTHGRVRTRHLDACAG